MDNDMIRLEFRWDWQTILGVCVIVMAAVWACWSVSI